VGSGAHVFLLFFYVRCHCHWYKCV